MEFDVVVATYKVSPEFITRCLESIVKQTVETWHCWIVDGTPENHESYKPLIEAMTPFLKSEKFTYLRQTGTGIASARNQACFQGTAPYLATLDGDDLWYQEHLEWMTEAIEDTQDTPVAIWWAGADVETPIISINTGQTYSHPTVIGWYEQFADILPRDTHYFIRRHPIIPSNAVVLRSRFEEIGGYDERWQIGEDTDLYLRLTGDPAVVGYDNNYWGHQIDAVSGYHGTGSWQTTLGGTQTSVSHNKSLEESQAELKRQTEERIQQDRPIGLEDKPSDVSEDYWASLIKIVNFEDTKPTVLMDNKGDDRKSISLVFLKDEKLYRPEEKGNFGDEISPIIVENLIGSDYDLRHNDDTCNERLLAIGSLMHEAQPHDYIFGTGFGIGENTNLSKLNVCAVRGPLSRKKFLELGVDCPKVFGDAALLLPDYYEPNYLSKLEDKIGVVPHWTTYPQYEKLLENSKQFYFINPTNSWQQVIDEIYSCDKIVSQSLHGLICADAYDTPNVWLEENMWMCSMCREWKTDSTLNPIESQPPCSCGWFHKSMGKNLPWHNGNFKFLDYLASQNREVSPISHLREALDADYYEGGNQVDLELLRNAFPFV